MYLNPKPTLITNTIKNLCKKNVITDVNDNLNLDAVARNSKA
jgi:hypothetical protein